MATTREIQLAARPHGMPQLSDFALVEAKTLVDLIEDSGQDLIAQQGDTPFAVRIINTNAKDNEEIIETFVLNKMQR